MTLMGGKNRDAALEASSVGIAEHHAIGSDTKNNKSTRKILFC